MNQKKKKGGASEWKVMRYSGVIDRGSTEDMARIDMAVAVLSNVVLSSRLLPLPSIQIASYALKRPKKEPVEYSGRCT